MIIGIGEIKRVIAYGVVLSLFVACSSDTKSYLASEGIEAADNSLLTMTFTLPKIASTRATASSTEKEEGVGYENYIDIDGGDYRIYFFNYNEESREGDKQSTLIARFTPDEVLERYESDYVKYTATGKMAAELLNGVDFKIVMLAGWGERHYPDVAGEITPGITTIDDICGVGSSDPDLARFDAFVGEDTIALLPSESLHIPFFGVQEYSAAELDAGRDITLSKPINMLRAVGKVEVAMESGDPAEIEGVWIVGYNKEGYSAPTGVYLSDDYYDPEGSAYNGALHLINGENDENARNRVIKFSNEEESDTWVCYLPEYNNMGDDFAFIIVQLDGFDGYYALCFAEYTDGEQGAYGPSSGGGPYDTSTRYDILRNRRFSFELSEYYLRTSSSADGDSRSGGGAESSADCGSRSGGSAESSADCGSRSGGGAESSADCGSGSVAVPSGIDLQALEATFPGLKFAAPKRLTITEFN